MHINGISNNFFILISFISEVSEIRITNVINEIEQIMKRSLPFCFSNVFLK